MEKYKVEIKWGVIFAIITLLWMLLEKTLGWHDVQIAKHYKYTWLFFPIAIFIFVLALKEKKQFLNGEMSWSEGFRSGIIIGFVVAAIAPLSQYLIHTFISPDYFENIITYSLETQADVTEKQLREYFNLGSYIKQAMIQAPIAGAVTAALVSLFLRNK